VSENNPTADEIQGVEPEETTVPFRDLPVAVTVHGPVRTQPLPAVDWSTVHLTVDAITPQKILDGNPRRSRIIFSVLTQAVWIGRSSQEVLNKTCFRQGAGSLSQLVLTHSNEVWVMADTSTAEVSVIEEYFSN
jgi:hypothetical protein